MSPKERFVAELKLLLQRQDITPESHLGTDEQPWDSLGVVVAQGMIDDAIGRHIEGAKVGACQTVGDLLQLVFPDT